MGSTSNKSQITSISWSAPVRSTTRRRASHCGSWQWSRSRHRRYCPSRSEPSECHGTRCSYQTDQRPDDWA